MRTFLVSLILLIFLFSCQPKEPDYHGPTVADGKVIDNISGKPIVDCDIDLVRTKAGSGMTFTIVDSKRTDSIGHFNFSFEGDPAYDYEIIPNSPYYAEGHLNDTYLVLGEKNENMVIKKQPLGWVNFHIKNEIPIDTADIYISIVYTLKPITGLATDTVLLGQTNKIGQQKIIFSTLKKGIEKKNEVDLNILPLDTINYNLYY